MLQATQTPYSRTSWTTLITKSPLVEKYCHKHIDGEKAHLFHAYDTDGTELETLDFLYSLVRLTKPSRILETGTWKGYGTIALASAAHDNGFGHVVTVENERANITIAQESIYKAGFANRVDIVHADSLTYLRSLLSDSPPFELSFFDSTRPQRPKEFEILHTQKKLVGLAVFHDTSRTREENNPAKKGVQEVYIQELDRLEKTYARGSLELPLSRGLRVLQL